MQHIIYQTSFTEKVIFGTPPTYKQRQELIAAGFRFNGSYWSKTACSTGTIGTRQFQDIITPMIKDQPDMAG